MQVLEVMWETNVQAHISHNDGYLIWIRKMQVNAGVNIHKTHCHQNTISLVVICFVQYGQGGRHGFLKEKLKGVRKRVTEVALL